ncbi:Holliday junction branch migration protein RuvA [Helicobacter bizzozeronii]|uniref:Holliday junction branch migration protein RuvA n=1 Tax=Helicobacter bizzozeronii TaxID=56877 RepID=UPI000CF1652C|nr:Holliday junction branch migration protein RuvA [Helicobacter bizzozeronii]
MIVGLVGRVSLLAPTFVELEVQGVIYGVHISLQTSQQLQESQEVFLHTTPIFREDTHLLFGFLQRSEQEIFQRLIKISGVGPKVALAILSTYDPTEFETLIQAKDLKALQKVPSVGAKLAGKIMLDLAGYFVENQPSPAPSVPLIQAVLALESLGFKKNEALKVCASLPPDLSTGERIKQALKQLK